MPALTKQDVLDTLVDPELNSFCLFVGGLYISAATFGIVHHNIRNGKISVEEGTQTNAYYNAANNKITTQLGTSPDAHARGLLLHECTHALFDVISFGGTTVTEEVVCYIVQHAYLLRKVPGYSVTAPAFSLATPSQNVLWQDFYHSVLDYAKRATSAACFTIDTSHWEFKSMRNHLRTLNIYQHLADATSSGNNGV